MSDSSKTSKVSTDVGATQYRVDSWFKDLPPEVLAKLKKFHETLLKFNKSLNLITTRSVQNSDSIHIADCVLATKIITGSTKNIFEIYDFGSGNGLPGIVFGIMNPEIKVQLVDSDTRKSDFLRQAVLILELKNVFIMNRAIEDLPDGSVKFAMSRDFSTISKSILAARKIFQVGGTYFHLKGEEWATEVSQIPTQLCTFWTPSLVGEYKLPVGEVRYSIIKTDKISD